jgi:hypothetical protein
MRFRKLRIAFSATCAIACVLLIALWVRSYWVADAALWRLSKENGYQAISTYGRLMLSKQDVRNSIWPSWEIQIIGNGYNIKRRAPTVLGFRIDRVPLCDILTVPFWFPVLMTGVGGIFPWIRWSNRFSLRTLLITTTLVAGVLGLIVVLSRQ